MYLIFAAISHQFYSRDFHKVGRPHKVACKGKYKIIIIFSSRVWMNWAQEIAVDVNKEYVVDKNKLKSITKLFYDCVHKRSIKEANEYLVHFSSYLTGVLMTGRPTASVYFAEVCRTVKVNIWYNSIKLIRPIPLHSVTHMPLDDWNNALCIWPSPASSSGLDGCWALDRHKTIIDPLSVLTVLCHCCI